MHVLLHSKDAGAVGINCYNYYFQCYYIMYTVAILFTDFKSVPTCMYKTFIQISDVIIYQHQSMETCHAALVE